MCEKNLPSYDDVLEEDREKKLEEKFLKLKHNYYIPENHGMNMNNFELIATPKLIEKYINCFTHKSGQFINTLYRNNNLTEEFLLKHSEKIIHNRHVWCLNKSCTLKVLEKLSKLSGTFVEEFINYMREHKFQTADPVLFEKILESDHSMDFKRYSDYPLLTPEIMLKYATRNWDVNELGMHPNFTIEKITEINEWYKKNKGVRSQKITYNHMKNSL